MYLIEITQIRKYIRYNLKNNNNCIAHIYNVNLNFGVDIPYKCRTQTRRATKCYDILLRFEFKGQILKVVFKHAQSKCTRKLSLKLRNRKLSYSCEIQRQRGKHHVCFDR